MFPYQELRNLLDLDIVDSLGALPSGPVCSDWSLQQVRALMLGGSFYKKLQPGGVSKKAADAALDKFKSINRGISPCFTFAPETEVESYFWSLFRDNMRKTLTPHDVEFSTDFIRESATPGPGSSLYTDNESFYTKLFASRISATDPYLVALYRAAIVDTGFWSSAERLRSERFGEEIVSGNRLFFVEKTTEIARTCCTEPLVNMLIQQALGAFLEICLAKSFGISLKTQPDKNRELARIGSIDGSFGTIDLASASDSISWSLCQQVIPENLLGFFRISRCERTILPDGSEETLNMISTMGNGFTFPLQSVIFACVVRSVYQMMNLHSSDPSTQFGVFGDDIIVRREAYDSVCHFLRRLGFSVNDSKSFNTGAFRESCGYDWYNGHFVRGVYIRSLETVSDVYSAFNRLTRWSALTGIRLRRSCRFLFDHIESRKRFLVPFSESPDAGFQVPFRLTIPKLDDRYWFTYRKLCKVAKRRKVPVDLTDSRELGYSFYNPDGFAASILGGYARTAERSLTERSLAEAARIRTCPDAFFTLRAVGGSHRYKVARQSIPFWDWPGRDQSTLESYKVDPYIADHDRLFRYADWEVCVSTIL